MSYCYNIEYGMGPTVRLEMIMKTVRYCKKFTGLGLVVSLFLLLGFSPGSLSTAKAIVTGFHISGRNLLDANGNNFIMRGINVPYNWYPEQTSSFANIKARGANTARVVLSNGYLWEKNTASEVASVISLCKANELVCVLEVHDTTGYGEEAGTASLAQAVDYWEEIKSVLDGEEAYVIINIGNEPYGNNNATNWIAATKNAIIAMRSAGFQHTLMVDAPNWGQDWEHIMRDNANDVLANDPNGNTIFSIHMYGVYENASNIQSYVSAFVTDDLPLVIGEFGHQHSDGDPNESAIMSVAEANGIGYLGWQWSNTAGNESYLDIVTHFNPNLLTTWGNRLINGKNGICSTSYEASIYGGSLHPVCSIRSVVNRAEDGWILESSEISNLGGGLNSTSALLYIGDNAQDKQYRSLLSFNTARLPDGATVTKVRLRLNVQGFTGGNIFTPTKTLGNLLVDISKPYFGSNVNLVVGDFQAAAGSNGVGMLSSVPGTGWRTVTLKSAAYPFVNLTGTTQFRLRFEKDDNDDLGADFLMIHSGEASAANRPQLIVEYYIP